MSLQEILRHPAVWRGRDHGFHHSRPEPARTFPTGFTTLDEQLPEAGWPRGALTEILFEHPGQGEFRLLLPALQRLTRAGGYAALVDPPWIPYAPALANAGIALSRLISIGPLKKDDRLWTLEQLLRSGHCPAVLAWPDDNLSTRELRRLQLAAEHGKASGFLFRPARVRPQHSPAAMRLQLQPPDRLDIFKCRGRRFGQPLRLPELAQNGNEIF